MLFRSRQGELRLEFSDELVLRIVRVEKRLCCWLREDVASYLALDVRRSRCVVQSVYRFLDAPLVLRYTCNHYCLSVSTCNQGGEVNTCSPTHNSCSFIFSLTESVLEDSSELGISVRHVLSCSSLLSEDVDAVAER